MKPPALSRILSVLLLIMAAGDIDMVGQAVGGLWDIPRSGGESITEPSPEATAMRRYQDFPVSYATGTADISIPLLDLPGGVVNVSLGLSYHTGGIKHDAVNNGTGLGWSLTGLGCVSRQVWGFPDEWKGYTGNVSNDVREFSQDIDYYVSIIEKKKDAEYDRYSYFFPGYAGSFIIKSGRIIHLIRTDLVIERIASADNSSATDAFVITTPEGVVYTFDVKETINYQYNPRPLSVPYYNSNYSCTSSWQLSSIKGPENQDSINITYKRSTTWTRNHDANLHSLSYLHSTIAQECGWITGVDNGTGVLNRTEFETPAVPDKITSRCGTIIFTHSGSTEKNTEGPRTVLISAELKDRDGNIIKKAFLDIERTLKSVTISADDVAVEKYSFTYQPRDMSGGYDMFGYCNGARNLSSWVSVLDDQLELSPQRSSDGYFVKSEILTGITDITGLKTTILYDPAVVIAPDRAEWSIFPEEVQIGVRISEITVSDPLTQRKRTRKLTYRGAVCSHDLWNLSYHDYLSLSGIRKTEPYFSGSMLLISRQYQGATYLANASTRGIPTESAIIYYSEVDESIEGNGIENPLKTTYRYLLDQCRHPYRPRGGMTGITAESDERHLGTQALLVPQYNMPYAQAMLPHPTSGFHEESAGFRPELVSKQEYEWRDGSYKLLNEEKRYYSKCDSARYCTGVFCESNTFKIENYTNGTVLHDIQNLNDVNYYAVYMTCGRMQCDSVVTTKYFPDGNKRTVRMVNIYHGTLGAGISLGPPILFQSAEATAIRPIEAKYLLPGFNCDSIYIDNDLGSLYPLGTVTSMGGESVSRYVAMSEHTGGAIKLAGSDLRRLPVVEKYVLRVNNESDSLLRRYEYGRFRCGSNTLTKPTRVYVETDGETESGRVKIYSQSYTGYDSRGRIAAMTDNTGKRISAEWDANYDALSKIAYPAVSLTTTYTYKPFTGYTRVSGPSGMTRNYTYTAGRLVSESNKENRQLAGYTYRFYGDGTASGSDQSNRFTATVHDDSGSREEVVYYDGFGQPVQTISTVAGGKLTAATVRYDALDRVLAVYRPVPVSSGAYTASYGTLGTNYYNDSNPYSSIKYRNAGGDHPVEVIREGATMREHPALRVYCCNSTKDNRYRCRRYRLGGSDISESVTLAGDWAAGELDVTEETDPDGCVRLTFTDWRGLKMLERRVLSGTTYADTYYLYDVRGQLRIVLQPAGSSTMTGTDKTWTQADAAISNYAFIYRYDRRGNCIYSKIPSAGYTIFRYDPYGRPAFRRTAAMEADGEAEFYLYDAIGRLVMTGLTTSSLPEEDACPAMTSTFQGSATGLASTGYPAPSGVTLTEVTPTVVNYYDSYACATMAGFSSLPPDSNGRLATAVKGRLAGSRVAVLTGNSGGTVTVSDAAGSLYTLYSYDTDGNITSRTATAPIPGSYIQTTTGHTRQGNPTVSVTEITTADSLYRVSHPYIYDSAGYLKSESVSVGRGKKGNTETMAAVTLNNNYVYDGIGRLSQEYHNSSTKTTYTYNLRGEITGVTTPAFTQSLRYDDGDDPCYNGNIGNMTLLYTGRMPVTRSFSYDGMDRLTGMTSSEGYSTSYTYTINSGPGTIKRYGKTSTGSVGLIDDLSVRYTGNRPLIIGEYADKVIYENSSDLVTTARYRYDSQGRVIEDSSRDITNITYNHLDLPGCMEFSDGNHITYAYSAAGEKLWSTYTRNLPPVTRSETRYYCGGAEFVSNGSHPVGISRYNTPWGYVDSRGGIYVKMRDYQGNIRGVVSSSGTVVQMTDYYPYGMPMQSSTGAEINRYKYGGKEFETESGLNQYDFEARTFLPQTCLFTTPDPKAGDYPGLNPYLYCAANPLKYIDPTGERLIVIDSNSGDLELTLNNDGLFALFDTNGNEIKENDYSLTASIFMDAINALSLSNTAKSVINSIINNQNSLYVNITIQEQNAFFYNQGRVNWNPISLIGGISFDFKTRSYTQDRVPEIGLIHELIHGKEWLDNGELNLHLNKSNVPCTEIITCIEENKIRSELGLPLRATYNSLKIGNKRFPKWTTIIPNYNFSNILINYP